MTYYSICSLSLFYLQGPLIFDEFKNKPQEKKSWASSSTVKTIQVQLLCLTWNLLILIEETTRRHTGAENISEQKRRREHLVRFQKEASLPHGHPVLPIRRATRRFTQHSVIEQPFGSCVRLASSWAVFKGALRLSIADEFWTPLSRP